MNRVFCIAIFATLILSSTATGWLIVDENEPDSIGNMILENHEKHDEYLQFQSNEVYWGLYIQRYDNGKFITASSETVFRITVNETGEHRETLLTDMYRIRSIYHDEHTNTTFVVNRSEGGTENKTTIYRSMDFGDTWDVSYEGLFGRYPAEFSWSSNENMIIWSTYGQQSHDEPINVFGSTDRGNSWDILFDLDEVLPIIREEDEPQGHVHASLIDDQGWIYVFMGEGDKGGRAGGTFISKDTGETWTYGPNQHRWLQTHDGDSLASFHYGYNSHTTAIQIDENRIWAGNNPGYMQEYDKLTGEIKQLHQMPSSYTEHWNNLYIKGFEMGQHGVVYFTTRTYDDDGRHLWCTVDGHTIYRLDNEFDLGGKRNHFNQIEIGEDGWVYTRGYRFRDLTQEQALELMDAVVQEDDKFHMRLSGNSHRTLYFPSPLDMDIYVLGHTHQNFIPPFNLSHISSDFDVSLTNESNTEREALRIENFTGDPGSVTWDLSEYEINIPAGIYRFELQTKSNPPSPWVSNNPFGYSIEILEEGKTVIRVTPSRIDPEYSTFTNYIHLEQDIQLSEMELLTIHDSGILSDPSNTTIWIDGLLISSAHYHFFDQTQETGNVTLNIGGNEFITPYLTSGEFHKFNMTLEGVVEFRPISNSHSTFDIFNYKPDLEPEDPSDPDEGDPYTPPTGDGDGGSPSSQPIPIENVILVFLIAIILIAIIFYMIRVVKHTRK